MDITGVDLSGIQGPFAMVLGDRVFVYQTSGVNLEILIPILTRGSKEYNVVEEGIIQILRGKEDAMYRDVIKPLGIPVKHIEP